MLEKDKEVFLKKKKNKKRKDGCEPQKNLPEEEKQKLVN